MSSISPQSVGLGSTAWNSARIVVGSVLERGSFRFPGSAEHTAQGEGESLHFFRIRVEQSLKGADVGPGRELSVFSPGQWFRLTHAEPIRAGVISYVARFYSGGLDADQIRNGMRVLFFLDGDPAPAGFPPGTLFLSVDGGYDDAERAADVVVLLQEGPCVEFDHLIRLKVGDRGRLPDGLTVRLSGSSTQRKTTELEASKEDVTSLLQLAHLSEPDSSCSWGRAIFGPYTIELRERGADWESLLVVRKLRRSSGEDKCRWSQIHLFDGHLKAIEVGWTREQLFDHAGEPDSFTEDVWSYGFDEGGLGCVRYSTFNFTLTNDVVTHLEKSGGHKRMESEE